MSMEESQAESENRRGTNQKTGREPKEPESEKTEVTVDEESESSRESQEQQKDYYDMLLRTQAEFDNYKKRTEKEIAGFRNYANAQLVKDLLAVIDDFQNALASPARGANSQFIKGMQLIYKNLYSVLEREGLSEINPKDASFDPWKHEAVEMVPTDEVPEHTVIDVIQPGYKFKDKILRPAKVRVAVEPKAVCAVKDVEGQERELEYESEEEDI
jgi:molecular chaperone GrpE